jgi:hypothetical protein
VFLDITLAHNLHTYTHKHTHAHTLLMHFASCQIFGIHSFGSRFSSKMLAVCSKHTCKTALFCCVLRAGGAGALGGCPLS